MSIKFYPLKYNKENFLAINCIVTLLLSWNGPYIFKEEMQTTHKIL